MISLRHAIIQRQCLVYAGYGDCVFRSATAACVRCGSTASFDAQAKQAGYMTWPDWLLCRLWPEYEDECRAFYAGTGKRFKARHPGLVRYIDGMMAACIAKSAVQAIAETP